ncbi:hypothetical protein JCM19231_2517 [Vibrio ishigakensis]|uniref:DNA mismatch repair protein n=1 Tax=Vibrio ishigakensis TaxID=1481914 RepID=A0A0B8NYY8_9VIBR|nr:hypothetical protein [Vibrio ishigakensis]GAM56263.1 hypothetical protein JCM19231_2517 [Vibrio ishigakensis]
MRRFWPPAWLLVLVGLLLNILAILISSQVIDGLVSKNGSLSEARDNNLRSIQLAWNRIENLERKKETMVVMLASESAPTETLDELKSQIETWTGKQVPAISVNNLQTLTLLVEQQQDQQRDFIDNYYLENVTLMESMHENDVFMSHYKNIALFLQIFGLALILARDLRPGST